MIDWVVRYNNQFNRPLRRAAGQERYAPRNYQVAEMRKTLYLLSLICCSFANADSVLLVYEPEVTQEAIEEKLVSFGFEIAAYWESFHGGHVVVPCGEAELWVTVLSEVKGISSAERDYVISAGGSSPSYIRTCAPVNEAAYAPESETLFIPKLHLDGLIYQAELKAPFNVQDLQVIGELNIYPYGK